jgi:hypothetical protein
VIGPTPVPLATLVTPAGRQTVPRNLTDGPAFPS